MFLSNQVSSLIVRKCSIVDVKVTRGSGLTTIVFFICPCSSCTRTKVYSLGMCRNVLRPETGLPRNPSLLGAREGVPQGPVASSTPEFVLPRTRSLRRRNIIKVLVPTSVINNDTLFNGMSDR